MTKILQEGDYCPECDMRQAHGQVGHMPKCSRSTTVKFETVFKGFKEGSQSQKILTIFEQNKVVTISELKQIFPEQSDNVSNIVNILKIKGFIYNIANGKWRYDGSRNDL